MTDEYKVKLLKNVVECENLEPPEWYDIKTGGHTYEWINLTNLKYNKTVINDSDLKKVYYFGLGKKGALGYKDGSYYDSCEDEDYINDKSDLNIEWGFRVVEFYKDYDMADWNETWYLTDKNVKPSLLYYNGNNGFRKMVVPKTDVVLKLRDDIEEASMYFMSKDPKDREGIIFNGFKYKVYDVQEIENFIPYQIPDRVVDVKVINRIYLTVHGARGDTSSIPPILAMNLKADILLDEKGNFYPEGKLNPAGNHRKIGSVAGGAKRMGVLEIPDFRISDFGPVEIKQLAIATNPDELEPRNPSGDDEYVDLILDMVKLNSYPINHDEIDKFLIGCNIDDKKKRDKLKSKAEDKKTHKRNSTTPIEWASKGWTDEVQRVCDVLINDNYFASVMSVESYNIEKFIDIRNKFKKNDKVLKRYYQLMHGKGSSAWNMWKYEKKGRTRARYLIDELKPLKNIEGKNIEVIFLELPEKHASIGVNNKNFWNSEIGKEWLLTNNIKLKNNK